MNYPKTDYRFDILTCCDGVQTFDGKPCIMGLWDVVQSNTFPTVHPVICLTGRILRSKISVESPKTVNIKFDVVRNLTGKVISTASGLARFGEQNLEKAGFSLYFLSVLLEDIGRYSIKASIDGVVIDETYFDVVKI